MRDSSCYRLVCNMHHSRTDALVGCIGGVGHVGRVAPYKALMLFSVNLSQTPHRLRISYEALLLYTVILDSPLLRLPSTRSATSPASPVCLSISCTRATPHSPTTSAAATWQRRKRQCGKQYNLSAPDQNFHSGRSSKSVRYDGWRGLEYPHRGSPPRVRCEG